MSTCVLATWTCSVCTTTGEGLPEACPACEGPLTLTQEGYLAVIGMHSRLVGRARDVANLLDLGSTHITLDDARADGLFEVEWTTYCGRGCCGPENHSAVVPNRYLWMPNADILAEQAARKEAAERATAEAARVTKLRRAEEAVALSRSMASGLAEMEARLATLRAEAT